MKRIITWLMLSALTLLLVLPVSADDNKNQIAQVLELTEGVTEHSVMPSFHLKNHALMEILSLYRETEEGQEFFTNSVRIDHMAMIRQRDIAGDGQPIHISLRAWGAGNRYLFVLFKAEAQEEWTIVSAAQGEFIEADFPGDGQYALAWSAD